MAVPKKTKAKAKEVPPVKSRRAYLTELVDDLSKVAEDPGAVQMLGSDGLAIKIRGVTSTQCPTIDHAIGRGGAPWGRLTIIHGAEGSGKTTLALHLAAETQRRDGVVLYMDKEYKLDPEYAKNLGVNVDEMILSQPRTLETTFKIIETAINKTIARRKATGESVPMMVILDSMNAARTKAEIEGEYDDHHIASQARVYSQSLPKIIPLVSKADVALVFISQVREKVGVMFGDKHDIAGGKAPKFYASLIMEVIKKSSIKKGTDIIGNRVEVYVRKNQIAPPFKRAQFEIYYGHGIDYNRALIERAEELGIVELGGSWYSYGEERLGQGMDRAAAALVENPKMKARMKAAVEKKDGYGG